MPDIYTPADISVLLRSNSYPGRGIIAGLSPDGKSAVAAYFIMGRSENSRNRVFADEGDDVTIYPFEPEKVADPSLIIYSPVRKLPGMLIVTNGDQTDTAYDGLKAGNSFSDSLASREFEPDAPNFTPRISALLRFDGKYNYSLHIAKSADAAGSGCNRFTFDYTPVAGIGHFIHTYIGDGSPLPTFCGEGERVTLPNTAEELRDIIWTSLNADNRISLHVRYTDLASGDVTKLTVNKNVK